VADRTFQTAAREEQTFQIGERRLSQHFRGIFEGFRYYDNLRHHRKTTWEVAVKIKVLLATMLCVGWALQGVSPASAQPHGYPDKPIRVVIPFPAGGPTDGMARIVAERLGTVLGQSIVVENRGGGAGGSIGARFVADSPPDGYTILITPGGSLTSGPAVHKEKIGYDPTKAFTAVAQLIETPDIMSVRPDLPIKNVAELVAYAKAHPGKLSWGSQGFGTAPHLLAEMFKLESGTNIVHVPYRGTAPMLAAILAGDIQIIMDPATTSLVHIQAGKLRPIMIAGSERFAKLPNVPTSAEVGFPKLNSPFWLGVVAPAGTPPAIVNKLNAAFRDALSQPKTRERLAALGAEIKIGTPQDFQNMLTRELKLWSDIVDAAGIKVE
jgi:tripartite-type tricarboxylate transporter receptor subunit TctC